MKKISLVACFCSLFLTLFAQQENEVNINPDTALATQVSTARNTADSLAIDRLSKQIEDLIRDNKTNMENINMLMASKDLDARNRYMIIRQNLESSIDAYRILNTKINNLKSYDATRLSEPLIAEINNPEGNRLGFQLNQKIQGLVEANVKPKKKNVASRIYDGVNYIAKSPVLGAIPAVSPAANLTVSVMGFLRSSSMFTDGIDQNAIAKLEAELNAYTRYYSLMNEAHTEFKYNLNSQKQEISVLQQSLYNQVEFFAKNIGFNMEPRSDQEELGNYLDRVFRTLNRRYVEQVFNDLEKSHTTGSRVNYDQILLNAKGNQLKDVNNRLEEFIGLINQYEFQYNTHFRYNSLYNEKMKSALDEAVKMGVTETQTAEGVKAEFEKLRRETDTNFKSSIGIDELLTAKQSIRYTARVI